MRRFVQLVLDNRGLALGLLSIYLAAGLLALQRLPIEAYPDVTNIRTQVIVLWPGHAAEEVEKFVTVPVENQLNGVPWRASLRSVSLFGLAQITLVFEDGTDSDKVRALTAQQLAQVRLPEGAQASLAPDSTPVGEIYRYTLQAPPDFPLAELRALEDWVVERQFRTVSGVVDVVGFGGPIRQFQVLVDPLKLKTFGLSLRQVTDALAASNQNAGGAYVERGSQMFIVRGLGLIERPARDIGATVLTVRNGTPVLVRDIGEVTEGQRLRQGRVGLNRVRPGVERSESDQDDVVQGTVLARRGENALEVLARVKAKAAEINATYLPAGVRLVPHYDRTDLIRRTLQTMQRNMVEGILLVLAVLVSFLGLRHWRSALIVAAVIPLALLGACALLDRQHIPANLISMGAIDFGIIVDAAVVLIEDVIHRLERPDRPVGVREAVLGAAEQMGRPILFSKVVLLTAFLPLHTLQRVEGRIFQPMALTLTYALAAGTALALALVPVLASWWLQPRGRRKATAQMPAEPSAGRRAILEAVEAVEQGGRGRFDPVAWLEGRYGPWLEFALGRRRLVLALAGAALLAAAVVGLTLGSEFLPKLNEGSLWVRVNFPESIAPSEAIQLTREARLILASFPEVTGVVSQLGRPDDGTDVNGFNTAEFSVPLRPPEEWTTARDRLALCAKMKTALAVIPGVETDFSQYIEDNVNEAVSGIKSELAIKVFGPDAAKLQEIADQLAARLQGVPGILSAGAEQLAGQPQIQLRIDRAMAARYGLSVGELNALVQTVFSGSQVTDIVQGERSVELVVKLQPEAIADLERIRAIPLFGSSGEMVNLGAVASVEVRAGYGRIFREDNERRIAVKLSVGDRDLGGLVREARQRTAAVALPPGYRLVWTGSFENQQRALARLLLVVPVTLAAIFFILYTAFRSTRLAGLILLNVPLAAVGGLVALRCAGLPLSVSALVGFVALFGASVQNGVILLESIRDELERGCGVLAAVRRGAQARLRAVLMTGAMAAFGLLPAALSHAVGAETARPFAVVIVGGLVSATLLTLFVLPVLATWFLASPPADGSPPTGPAPTSAAPRVFAAA